MPKMISRVAHVYGGRSLAAGDPFDADKKFVATLVAIGRAELAGPDEQYQTRDMGAAPPAAPKRKYNTKRKAA